MIADKVRRCLGMLMDGRRCEKYIHHAETLCPDCSGAEGVGMTVCSGRDEIGAQCGTKIPFWGGEYCDPCREKLERAWQAHLDKYRKELAEAKHRYPEACERCLGRGGRYAGGSFEAPAEWVDCPSCIEEDHCPRCGGPLMLDFPDENMHCGQNCGWHYEAEFAGFEVFEDGTMNVYISDHNAEEIDKFSDLCDNMEIEYKIV